jgi:hypothetical protein
LAAPTCGLDFERRLSAPAAAVRQTVSTSLREQGFKLTAEMVSRIEARRGSLFGSSILLKRTMAVRAMVEVIPETAGVTVRIHLADNIPNFGKTWGVNHVYEATFAEIASRVDAALARLDPAASPTFEKPHFWTRSSNLAGIDQGQAAAGRVGEAAVEAAGKALEGSSDTTPAAWRGIDAVTFRASPGSAVMSLADLQAMLGIAVMVSAHPGDSEAADVREIEDFSAGVERRLDASGGRAISIDLPERFEPVFRLLWEQARTRAGLPMRELHVCTTCRTEKITNPDYERIANRTEKLGDLVAGVGATISTGGISPTFVLGQVFKLKRLMPDYVCGKCQGMSADEFVVTFCPGCAELEKGAVLDKCGKCGFSYGTLAPTDSPWAEVAPEPSATPPIVPGPPPIPPIAPPPTVSGPPPSVRPGPPAAASPRTAWPTPGEVTLGTPALGPDGLVCGSCGRGYAALWRVVAATPAGFEERFLCGTSPACQSPSQVPPIQVRA